MKALLRYVLVPIFTALVGRTAVAIINAAGYYPDTYVARLINSSPELARLLTSAGIALVLWLTIDFFVYGLVTFSSCEGHEDERSSLFDQYTSVAFYAHEDEAKFIHNFLLRYTGRLLCSRNFRGNFVPHRDADEFVLGWTLENWGIKQEMEREQFIRRTLQAAWSEDIPTLIRMFTEITDQRLPNGPPS